MPQSNRADLLQRIEKPRPAKAKLPLQDLESSGKLLRLAIARTGLSPKEAAALLGINDASQFNRMLAGVERFPVHLLLQPSARVIWRELVLVTAECAGYVVERVVRWTESA